MTVTTASYSQTNFDREKNRGRKKSTLFRKTRDLDKESGAFKRTQIFKRKKIKVLQNELNNKIQVNQKFEKEIDELSQETESLAEEIDKWQM